MQGVLRPARSLSQIAAMETIYARGPPGPCDGMSIRTVYGHRQAIIAYADHAGGYHFDADRNPANASRQVDFYDVVAMADI